MHTRGDSTRTALFAPGYRSGGEEEHPFIQHVLQAQQTADAEPLECREHVQVCALEEQGWTVQHIATVQGHRTRACIEEYPAPHT